MSPSPILSYNLDGNSRYYAGLRGSSKDGLDTPIPALYRDESACIQR
jgi:hypothetical protein